MEGAEGLLKALKGLPLWFLAGLSVTAAIALVDVPLQAGLPASWRPPLPLATVGLVTLTLFALAGHVASYLRSRGTARRAENREKLGIVYAPLVALFVRRHVTTCTGVGAPRFRHRLANAWEELFKYKRLRVGVRRAIRALGDRQSSTSAEVEYGGAFPLEKIYHLVAAHPVIAGAVLLNLVRRADRSQYEDGPKLGLMSDEEYALFKYVHQEHDRLARAWWVT